MHNCLKKSTLLTKFNFFFPQNWHFCTNIDVEKNTRHFTPKFARHDFITVLKKSLIWPKTNTFCIKWHFLTNGNNATKNWHFSKTENTSLRKLTMSTRNYNFWKEWPFARKMKISFNIGVSARFPLIPVKQITKKIEIKRIVIFFKLTTKITSNTNCHFSRNWQLN